MTSMMALSLLDRRQEDRVIRLETARPSPHAILVFASHHFDIRLHLHATRLVDQRTDVSSLPQPYRGHAAPGLDGSELRAYCLWLLESRMSRSMLDSMLATSRTSLAVCARLAPRFELQLVFTSRTEIGASRASREAQIPDIRTGCNGDGHAAIDWGWRIQSPVGEKATLRRLEVQV